MKIEIRKSLRAVEQVKQEPRDLESTELTDDELDLIGGSDGGVPVKNCCLGIRGNEL